MVLLLHNYISIQSYRIENYWMYQTIYKHLYKSYVIFLTNSRNYLCDKPHIDMTNLIVNVSHIDMANHRGEKRGHLTRITDNATLAMLHVFKAVYRGLRMCFKIIAVSHSNLY